MDKLYIETSIVSYATAWPSRNIAIAGLQQQARDWWATNCRHIANAHELPRIYSLLDGEGLGQLLICTPTEFLGSCDDDDESNS